MGVIDKRLRLNWPRQFEGNSRTLVVGLVIFVGLLTILFLGNLGIWFIPLICLVATIELSHYGRSYQQAALAFGLFTSAWALNSIEFALNNLDLFRVSEHFKLPDLLTLSGFIVLIVALSRLQPKTPPKASLIFWYSLIAITLIFIIPTVINGPNPMLISDLAYLVVKLALLFACLPQIEAGLRGQGAESRLIWGLGLVLSWMSQLLLLTAGSLTPAPVAELPHYPAAVLFLGYSFMFLGLLGEAREARLGIWPFALGVGALQVAWTVGMVGIGSTPELWAGFLTTWGRLGAYILFMAALGLFTAHYARRERAESYARSMDRLLIQLTELPERPLLDPTPVLSQFFEGLKSVISGVQGLHIDADPGVCLGQQSAYPVALVDQGRSFGTLYLDRPEVDWDELRGLLPLLSERLHHVVRNVRWQQEALTDPLTKLANRRGLERSAELWLQTHIQVSLIMIDLDRFKQINDEYGHAAGDQVLQYFAMELKNHLPEGGEAFRLGGDEFLVTLPGPYQVAAEYVEKLRQQPREKALAGVNREIEFSAGIGGGAALTSLEELETWLLAADQAMYESKRSGHRHEGGVITLRLLGGLHMDYAGQRLELRPRHAELLAVLALHPEGLNLEQITQAVYGEDGSPDHAKAELSRLRKLCPAVASRPYRLAAGIQADFIELMAFLSAGQLEAALKIYRGPFLPHSEAPEILEYREILESSLRGAALKAGNLACLHKLAQLLNDDLELWESVLSGWPENDSEYGIIQARVVQLQRSYGV